jgi:ribonucleoside-diphosphate reductase alpha chain
VKSNATTPQATEALSISTDPQHQLNYVDPPESCGAPDLTQNAITVLERRYLKKDPETGTVIETPKQLFWRVASHVAKAELAYAPGNYERAMAVATEFYDLMATRMFLPNSPCLMNAGREMGMLSACFVLPVEDSIEGIFEAIKATALIQKAGGGTGFSFSRLRPKGDIVTSSGGTTEGPMSFIEVFSKATDAIQQGAFRRGANMGMMRVDHPDIHTFITFKDDPTRLTNYNISVAVTDKFLEDLKSDPTAIHQVQNPRSGKWKSLVKEGTEGECWTVGELWDVIIEHAHRSGEPGVIFIDRINQQNPIKNVGTIEATNPCGEQPLHAWDSCNLGSVNLGNLIHGEGENATFDWPAYKSIIHATTRFLDNVIEVNRYPLPQIDNMSKTTRRIGLGVMGFADALYKMGIGYDTPEGTKFGEEVMAVLDDESHLASEMLAEERGCFPAWEGSDWETKGRKMRNSYTTTVAPTGTISIIANCSGGIEPMFSLAFNRQVMKDTEGKPTIMKEVNYVFEEQAKAAGCFSDEMIDEIIEQGSIQHMDGISDEMKNVFVTAHDITPYWHMKMQAAFQRHCDASISKTINFPTDATPADVREIYEMAVEEGVKGVTVYRDGCREMQPMALKESGKKDAGAGTSTDSATEMATTATSAGASMLSPAKLPEMMPSVRIRQTTPFGNMHVQVSYDPESGAPREVFAQLGRAGDVANSDLEGICRMVSLWLRANGSLEMVVNQLKGIGSSLSVPTRDGRIMSLPDGLACALQKYMDAKANYTTGSPVGSSMAPASGTPQSTSGGSTGTPGNVGSYKIKCPTCSEKLAFEEGCVKCYGCGYSQC